MRKARISVGRVGEQQSCPLHRWYVSSKTLVGACRLINFFFGGSLMILGKGKHTKDGKAKIRPAVEKLCKK